MKYCSMRTIASVTCFLIWVCVPAGRSEEINTVGTVILLEGKADLSSFVSGERFSIDESTGILIGHKIRTDKKTLLDIALNDGSMISLKESTAVYFYYLKTGRNDPPSKFKMDFGKIRMNQDKTFPEKNLEIITPAAVVSVVMADFSLVAADYATLVLVHRGRVGLASSSPRVKEAYVGTEGEEVLVPRDGPPILLGKVRKKFREKWISDHLVVDKFRRIVRKDDRGDVINRIGEKKELW